jgi:hypothetical protein
VVVGHCGCGLGERVSVHWGVHVCEQVCVSMGVRVRVWRCP